MKKVLFTALAVVATIVVLSCNCSQNSGVAKTETEVAESTSPIAQNAWTEAVSKAMSAPAVYSIIRIVEASDGHDYVVGWLYKEQITILHAVGCRKCAGIAEKTPPSPVPPHQN